MAYKFQFGQAILSGALDQEGDVDILDSGVLKMAGNTAIDASRNATLLDVSGSGEFKMGNSKLRIGNAIVSSTAAELNLLDTAVANTVVNSKAVIYGASGEVAGTLSTAAQPNITSVGTLTALAVGGDVDLGDATSDTITATGRFDSDLVPSSDSARDLGSNALKWKELYVDDIKATSISGSLEFALTASEGITAFTYNGGATAHVGLASSVAGAGLGYSSGVISVGEGSLIDVAADAIAVDLTEAAARTIADGDHLIFLDGGATGEAAKGSTQDLAALLAGGDGLGSSGSQLDVQVSGAIIVASDKVSITGSFAGPGLEAIGGDNSISAIDLNVSTITTVLTGSSIGGNDQFAVFETGVAQKKATLADIAKALAGSGISANPTTGELSTEGGAMNVFTGAGALSEGYNVQNATTSMTMTLPTATEGDVVTVKAGNLSAGNVLTIARNGGDPKNIEGAAASILLESPRAAVTLVYASDALGWFVV